MSYIPPHKRYSKDPVRPSPVPDFLLTKFKKNLDFKGKGNAIVYSRNAISKWFLTSSNGLEDEVPPSLKLVPVSSGFAECSYGEKSLVLMNNNVQKTNMITEEIEEEERTRWMLVAEKIEDDLVYACEQAKNGIKQHYHVDNAKLRLVARFGKILFSGRQAGPVAECSLRKSNKTFSTDVPTPYIENIKSKVVPSHEFCIDEEKETYIVKVSHYTRPDATISCKCTMKEDGRLSMYKAELNPVRHLVVDVSCIDKSLDMRLMLAANRKIMALTEKEKSSIKGFMDSAIVDPNVKGGVRWPLGKTLSEDGYRIFEVCHVRATIYKNRTLKLRVRETDRLDVRSGTGEIKRGVTLILQDINTKMQDQNIERGCVLEMLRDALGTIGDFLCCDAKLTL